MTGRPWWPALALGASGDALGGDAVSFGNAGNRQLAIAI